MKILSAIYNTLRAQMRMPDMYYWVAVGISIILFFLSKEGNWRKRLAFSVLAGYLFLAFGTTIFRRRTVSKTLYKLELFQSYRIIAQKGILKARYRFSQTLLNILLLSPIGFLMPVFVKRKHLIILFGFLFSLLIETLQLVLRRGCFELDDLFNNTLGVALAYGCVELVKRLSD